jgi:mannose-6-phosphate isomerase class I
MTDNIKKAQVLYCLENENIIEVASCEQFQLSKGMMYIVSDDLSSHRSITAKGVTLLIIDGDFLKLD